MKYYPYFPFFMQEIVAPKNLPLPRDDLRQTGIDVVGSIPWGSHFCQFCQTKEDLLETLVPYFREGLNNNEFCVWVTCEFLTKEEARRALETEIPNYDEFEKKGQIEIFPYDEWYLKGEKFEMDRILNSWLQKYESGLARGFYGLRVSGNPFWLENKQDWQDFTEYESSISGAIAGKNILVLCTYSLEKCGASEIIDVVNNHEFALIKRNGVLEIIESAVNKKTQAALRENEEKFRLVADCTYDWENWIGPDGNYIYVSPSCERITGYRVEDFMKNPRLALNIVHPEDRAAFENHKISHSNKEVGLGQIDFRIVTANGETKWISHVCQPVFGKGGEWLGRRGSNRDITSRKQTEEALRKSEEKFALIATSTPDHILMQDKNLRYTMVLNPQLGLTEKDMIGKTDFDFLSKTDAENITQIKKRVMETGAPEHVSIPLTSLQGDIQYFEGSYIPRRDQLGQTDGIIGYFRNVTEQKKLQNLLQTKSKEQEAILDSAPTMIFYKDKKNRFLRVNKAFGISMGLSKEQLEGKSLFDIYPKEQANAFWKVDLSVIKSGKAKHGIIESMNTTQGTRIVQTDKIPYLDEQGNVIGVIGFAVDITKRKKSEKALRESEERYRTLFDAMTESYALNEIVLDKNGAAIDYRFIDVNPSFEKFIGLAREEMVDKLRSQVPIVLNRSSFEAYGRVALTGKPEYFENYNQTLDKYYGVNVYSPSPLRFVTVFNDITESKKADIALRESEEKYRKIIETANEGVMVVDENFTISYTNQKMADMLGYPVKELIGRKSSDFMDESGKSETPAKLELRKKGIAETFEHKFIKKDGTPLWTFASAAPIFDKGKFVGSLGMITDITERKLAEKEINHLASFPRINPNPIIELDLDGNITFFNESAQKAGGKDIRSLIAKDLAGMIKALKTCDSPTSYCEINVGGRIYGETIHFLKDLNSIRIYAFDVTERKLAEERLNKMNRTLKALSNSSLALVGAADEKSYLKDICKIIIEDCGYALTWIGFRKNDDKKRVEPVACAGFEDGYLETLNITWADAERGHGPTGTAVRTGLPCKCSNMLTDPAFAPWRDEAVKRGYASSLSLPLLHGDAIMGAITVYSPQPEAFLNDEVGLLKKLADNVANGMIALRLGRAKREAEEASKISELKYRRLFESAKDGILILDFETGIIVDVNPFLVDLLGYSYADLLKKHPWNIGPLKDILSSKNAFLELQKNEFIRYENLPLETKGGKKILVEFVSNAYFVDHKKVIQCNVRDITERKLAEEELRKTNQRLAIISYTANRLLTSENPQLIVQDLCQRVMKFLDCQVFFNFLLDNKTNRLHLNAGGGVPQETIKSIEWLNLGDAVCGCVARDGSQMVCDHIQESEDIKTKLVRSFGTRAYACHPLLEKDKVIGTLSFGTTTRDAFSKADLALMRAITDQVAIAMIRVQSEKNLRETKDYLENLIDHANAPIVVWNPDFTITRFNGAFERLTQYSSSDIIGRQLDILFPEIMRDASLDKIKLTLGGEQWQVVEIPVQRRDGSARIALWNSANVYSEDGKTLLATIAQGQDITEIKLAQESLRESEEKFRRIADAMPNLVWTEKPSGNVEYVNLTFRDYTGIQKISGVIWNAIPLNANDRREMEITRKRAVNSGQAYQLEQQIRRSDGNWRWHLTKCVPIIDNGIIIKWYGTATDIDNIKIAAERLREADEEKSKFISTMSHELRNPLTPVVTGIELVKSYLDQQETDETKKIANDAIIRESVSIIDQQAKQMARLLDDMLDISRISRGKIQLKKQPVSIRDTLASAIKIVTPLIKSQNHQFSAVLPDEAARVLADPVRLQQIFVNLLNNAIKYTPPGGQIWLMATQTGNFAQITVRDTGLGIEPDNIRSIFMSYGNSRGVTPFVSTQGELGIGLKLTRDLVSLHGGTITASSAGKDKGCEFIVRLRLLLPGEELATDTAPDDKTTAKSAGELRALVVDDNASAADMTAKALNFFGHNAKVCYDTRAALELAISYQPHIMFIDIEMPGMNGYELAKTLRKMEGQSIGRLKLVAVTGYGQKEDKERALAAGFDLHLSKPVEMQSLQKAINDLIPDI